MVASTYIHSHIQLEGEGKMKVCASVTPNRTKFGPLLFPGELYVAIQELSKLGYDGIELSLRTVNDVDLFELQKSLDENEIELLSIATGQSYVEDGYSLFHSDSHIRDLTIERLKEFIDLKKETGGGSVILGGIKGRLDEKFQNTQFDQGSVAIDKCLEYAEKRGVVILLEAINRYETNIMVTIGECVDFAKERGSQFLRVLADTFHMNIEEISIKGALDSAGEYLGAIHCADSNRLAPGMGHIDFQETLKSIDTYNSLAYLGVEVLPFPDSNTCARNAIELLNGIAKGFRHKVL